MRARVSISLQEQGGMKFKEEENLLKCLYIRIFNKFEVYIRYAFSSNDKTNCIIDECN